MGAFLLLVFVLTEQAGAQSTTIYASAHGGPSALGSTLYTLDAITGNATPIMDTGKYLGALALAPNKFSNGIGSFETSDRPNDITFRPSDGSLFAYVGSTLYTVDRATGLATFVGGTSVLS